MGKPAQRPAELFPLSEHIQDELTARGWSQQDLADRMERPIGQIKSMMKGKRPLMPKMADALANAMGTSAEFWINLDRAYRNWKNGY